MTHAVLYGADEVSEMTSLSVSQIRLMARRGEFPAPRQLTPKRVAWVRAEVEHWIAEKTTPTVAD